MKGNVMEETISAAEQNRPGTDPELLLVSLLHPLPEDYAPRLVPLEGDWQIDPRAREPLLKMLADCRAAGGEPVINSAYRSAERQRELFEKKIESIMTELGWERRKARGAAAWLVAPAGTSEHQTGLAVDITDEETGLTSDPSFSERWLAENAWRYGFILRYPKGKETVTGIQCEPWHFRYVGEGPAREMFQQGLTLEEYLGEQ